GVLLSITLAAVVSVATGMSGVQCGAAYPVPGGAYTWSRILGMKSAAFVAGCCFLAKEVVGLGFIALTFALYLTRALPGVPVPAAAAGVVVAVTALNYFGVDLDAGAMALLAAV